METANPLRFDTRGAIMNLWELKKGDKVKLQDGIVANVLARTQDGQWIRVRYVLAPENPELVGSEDLCSESEVLEIASDVRSKSTGP